MHTEFDCLRGCFTLLPAFFNGLLIVINSIGDTFDFLSNYQYSDDEGADEEPQNIQGPFSSGREKTYR